LNREVWTSKNSVKDMSEVYYSFRKNTVDINFDVNSFLFLLIYFMVGELGSEELE